MTLKRSNFRRVLFIFLALFLAVFFVSSKLIDTTPPSARVELPDDKWQMSSKVRPDAIKAAQFLGSTTMWGVVQVVKITEEEKDPRWHILGIMRSGKEKFVLISIDKQPNQQLVIGDTFPGGGKLIDITEDAICLLINGKKRSLSLAKQGALAL